MKSIALIFLFLLCVHFSSQLPKLVNCPSNFTPPSFMATSCGIFTCFGPNKILELGCPVRLCPEEPVGYNEQDDTKLFPDCCGGPICAE